MKHRLKRVNELLRREIGLILQKDFVFSGALVTINGVEVTVDLKQALVYLGIIGSPGEKKKALDQLNKKRGFIQGRIAKRVTLKETPQLLFRVDESVERGVSVLSIIDAIDIPDELPPETGESS